MALSDDFSDGVIDLAPWPTGLGFENADTWWSYARRQSEEERLDLLILVALLNPDACQLLLRHDPALLQRFAFSDEMLARLGTIHAETLVEYAAHLWQLRRDNR